MRARLFVVLAAVLALALAALACAQEPQEIRTVPSGTPRVFAPSTATPVAPNTVPSSADKVLVPTDTVPSDMDKAPSSPDKPKEEPVVLLEKVDGYLALVPAQLRSGEVEGISVSLFQGQEAARGDVEVVLIRGGNPVANGKATIEGSGTVSIPVPRGLSGGI